MVWWRKLPMAQGLGIGFLLALVAGLAPWPAWAEQHESLSQFFLNERADGHAGRPLRQPRVKAATPRPPNRTNEIRAASAQSALAPVSKSTVFVTVFGDAFGAHLARGLTDAAAGLPGTRVDDRTSEATELSVVDPAAWVAIIDSARAQAGRLDVALIMIGGDEVDPLTDERGEPQAPGTAAWRELYGARVEKIAGLFREKRILLIWVGLPIVRDDGDAKVFADRNAILRERAPKGGAIFVDAWEAFADENGQYSTTGPDVNGQTATLRRKDGWGFTRAGARKLASFVEPDLKREQDRVAASNALAAVPNALSDAFDQALSIDINAQIRREAGLPSGQDGTPSDKGGTAADAAASPVVVLTSAPISVGGTLAVSDPSGQSPAFGSASPAGLAVGSRPGRTDDFTWPPHS